MSTALVGVSTDTDNSRHATSNPHRPLRHCPRSTALAAHCPPTPRPRPCPTSPAPYQPALQQQSPTVTNSHNSLVLASTSPPVRPSARPPVFPRVASGAPTDRQYYLTGPGSYTRRTGQYTLSILYGLCNARGRACGRPSAATRPFDQRSGGGAAAGQASPVQ